MRAGARIIASAGGRAAIRCAPRRASFGALRRRSQRCSYGSHHRSAISSGSLPAAGPFRDIRRGGIDVHRARFRRVTEPYAYDGAGRSASTASSATGRAPRLRRPSRPWTHHRPRRPVRVLVPVLVARRWTGALGAGGRTEGRVRVAADAADGRRRRVGEPPDAGLRRPRHGRTAAVAGRGEKERPPGRGTEEAGVVGQHHRLPHLPRLAPGPTSPARRPRRRRRATLVLPCGDRHDATSMPYPAVGRSTTWSPEPEDQSPWDTVNVVITAAWSEGQALPDTSGQGRGSPLTKVRESSTSRPRCRT